MSHSPSSRPPRRRGQPHRPPRADGVPEPQSPRQPPAVEESNETRTLRAKYGPKLDTLKELVPTWSDEDLLFALADASGEVELAYNRISEGHVQQWGAVTRKKEKKAQDPTPSHHQRDSTTTHPGRGLRGGFRGGPRGGGATGRGGARFARGSGREQQRATNGYHAPSPSQGTGAWGGEPSTSDTWGVPHEVNGDAGGAQDTASGWGLDDSTAGASTPANGDWGTPKSNGKAIDAAQPKPHEVPQQTPAPVQARTPAVAKLSWAQVARSQEKAKPVAPPPVQAAAPAPVAVPPTESAVPQQEEQSQWEDPVTAHPPPTWDDEPQRASGDGDIGTNAVEAVGDAWVDETSQAATGEWEVSQESHENEAPEAPAAEEEPVPEPISEAPESVPAAVITSAEQPAAAPAPTSVPALAPESAPTPTIVAPAPSLAAAHTASPGPPGLPGLPTPAPTPQKPSTPLAKHTHARRFKNTDQAVVMPAGSGHVGSSPSLSFGTSGFSIGSVAVGSGIAPAFGGGMDRFGMQFGSLSLGGDDEGLEIEPSSSEPSAPVEKPAQEQELTPAPTAAPVSAAAAAPSPAPAAEPAPQPKAVSTPAIAPSAITPEPPVAAPAEQQQPQQPAQSQQQGLTSSVSLPATLNSGTSYATSASLYQQPSPQPTQIQQPQQAQPQQSQPQQHAQPQSQQQQQSQHHQQQPQASAPQPQQPQALPAQIHAPAHASIPTQLPTQSQHIPAPAPAFSTLPSHLQQAQHTAAPHLSYPQQHNLPPHLDLTSQVGMAGPAANAYQFRQADPYFHAHTPTPPQNQLSHQDISISSPYGAFAALGQQGQAGHLGAFASSPAPGEYGVYGENQRGFYDTYNQAANFANRGSIGHDDNNKNMSGAQQQGQSNPSLQQGTPQLQNQTHTGQQNALGQGGQPSPAHQAQQQQQQQQYPGMPMHGGYGYAPYNYYMGGQYYSQSPAYPPPQQFVKYSPMYQPGPAPGPAPPQAASKPPVAASASNPYGSSQSHLYHPGQAQYDDPSAYGAPQVGGNQNPTGDYGKQTQVQQQQQQQQQLYGQTGLNLLGSGGRAGASPEAYKQYGNASGADKSQNQPARGGQAGGASANGGNPGLGGGAGGVGQPAQQGGYYGRGYGNAPQPNPNAQVYPNDGFYGGYQPRQPQPYWGAGM
ncbi:hypothetical protein BOTBODRAFT_147297 [Botryobasidium botryosum FD-172 SS1]|uniref:RNA polymerase II degradation factor 1 n=1 Tax=Botryobasidium botryosum (strain FD-172 SS1) TaxID=930990 RepID=A0A067MI28_BOTB1|nr:hypothetical protein BOTBODRAFT_147297 [Botryobasidium botryosum FD-172 SS1]